MSPGTEGFDLQTTLAISIGGEAGSECPKPHHPLTCRGGSLYFFEDGRFACEHATVPADDQRTRGALTHSIAVLILECAAATLR